MKAAVYKGKQRFSVEEVPTPEAGPGQVLIEVKYCAICGTDVHAFLYEAAPPGTVMGHEYCGTIAQVGPGVTAWREGDRAVGGGGLPPPGKAPAGHDDPRYNYRTMGFDVRKQRAYAEYVVHEEWEPLPIPEGVTDEMATLTEPAAVAVRAVRRSALKLGDSVAVIGAGPIGLLCLQAAKAAGAGAVYVSEPVDVRRNAARELGADAVIDPTDGGVVDEIASLSGGDGPDVVFDCAGIRATLDQALNMPHRGGQVVLVAVPWQPMPLEPVDWMAREVNLQTTFGTRPEDWRITLEMLRTGKISTEPLLHETDFIPLDDIQQAFEALVQPTTQVQMVVRVKGKAKT